MSFDATKINWDKIRKPSSKFKLFEPSKEKFLVVGKHLLEGYLNLSDEYRMPSTIYGLMNYYFVNPNNLTYEIGNMQGLLGFTTIIPSFKAEVMFKLFDPKVWGADFARESKELSKLIMDEFDLLRLNTSTPDERVKRMAEMVGFEVEGKRRGNFVFNDRYYDEIFLVKFREV